MTLTAGGWAFLVTAWLLIGSGTAWCVYRAVLTARAPEEAPPLPGAPGSGDERRDPP